MISVLGSLSFGHIPGGKQLRRAKVLCNVASTNSNFMCWPCVILLCSNMYMEERSIDYETVKVAVALKSRLLAPI